ncbi:MAG TPA: asparagine--tRNA ligase [Anaerolineae bacterium]|nr:asparagine--tRNA ligase [Anaerolineae bacterium]HIQ05323.1 asparagine--tRNA ligase [Anaerolineae bacterium]
MQIQDIAQYEGQEVAIRGWVQLNTEKGRLVFLRVRDGTGACQAVVFKKNVSPETFKVARRLPIESSIIVYGSVRQDDRAPGIPGGHEIDVQGIEVIQIAEDYPITPKEHGVEFLMDHRHLWLRSNRQWAIMRVRATVIKAIRDWLDGHGFLLVDTPILTPSAAEGTTSLFQTDYHGMPAYLTQSGQLYNEANIFAFGKVYCFGPTFRAEKSKTRRHLQEFWMVEPEIAFCQLDQLMDVHEQFVSYIVQTTLKERAAELKLLGRDTRFLEKVTPPFPRITYDEAVEMINDAATRGVTVPPDDRPVPAIEWGDDFGAPQETYIAAQFDRPVQVHHYPTEAKAFYMEPEPDRPEVCRSCDVLAPEGYGEIIGGSERIFDPDKLIAALERHNLPREPYEWYIDLRRYGSVPHSGFGLGVERTVAWICGIHHVRETIAFPRVLGRLYP